MPNKRGKSWDFPNYQNPEEMKKLYEARINMLELQKAKLQERVEELESALAESGIPLPEEILEAHIVTDLDKE